MLRLRGKNINGEWLLFGIEDLYRSEYGRFMVCVEDVGMFAIDPATIEPADDPRKQMLDEIRKRVSSIKDKTEAASAVKFDMYKILDEMEAKL